jgi:dihydrolipoamide dehydrogenase
MDKFDIAIIGAGPGGYTAAFEALRHGYKTVLIEEREIGGTCLNRGCIPTKTYMYASEAYLSARDSSDIGINAETVSVDMKKLLEYKNSVTEKISSSVESQLKRGGAQLIKGRAVISGAGRIHISDTDTEITADNIIIATGTEPTKIRFEGSDLDGVMDSDAMLSADNLPERLVIVGGGVIGMEFASIYSALGSSVTVIEALDKILANFDRDLSQNLKLILKKRGVDIHTSSMLKRIEKINENLICTYEEKGNIHTANADRVLIAIGRKPTASSLFTADYKNVSIDPKGYIITNDKFETTVPKIYAIGDITGRIQLAHAAEAEAINCINIIAGESTVCDLNTIPSCVYTDPEIASAGLNEQRAITEGIDYKVLKYAFHSNAKSVLTRQERSFVKILIDPVTETVLGAQMMCARATDMIGEFVTAVDNHLTVGDIKKCVRPHPTYNEAIWDLLRDL